MERNKSGTKIQPAHPGTMRSPSRQRLSQGNVSAGGGGFATNPTLWLLLWTANNIGVTLLNKAAFSKVDFHYPFFLSAVHMACNMAGAYWVFWSIGRAKKHAHADEDEESQHGKTASSSMDMSNSNKHTASSSSSGSSSNPPLIEQILGKGVVRHPLDKQGQQLILAFSVIFSLNIAVGNVSLKFVSVNFNQVMRSLVPAITIAMGVCLGKPASKKRILSVVPVIIGVAMACFGDMSYTIMGFSMTVLCIILAALKVVASGELLTGNKVSLHPVDLLAHMAPLALLQCLALALLTGEISSIAARWETELSPSTDIYPMFVVVLSGVFSFSLNICSLQANKLTSPLTLCIAANVKQVLMIGMSTVIFGTEITPLNGAGIVVVLCGSARYSYVSVLEKQQKQQQQQQQQQAPPKPKEIEIGHGQVTDESANSHSNSEMASLIPNSR